MVLPEALASSLTLTELVWTWLWPVWEAKALKKWVVPWSEVQEMNVSLAEMLLTIAGLRPRQNSWTMALVVRLKTLIIVPPSVAKIRLLPFWEKVSPKIGVLLPDGIALGRVNSKSRESCVSSNVPISSL